MDVVAVVSPAPESARAAAFDKPKLAAVRAAIEKSMNSPVRPGTMRAYYKRTVQSACSGGGGRSARNVEGEDAAVLAKAARAARRRCWRLLPTTPAGAARSVEERSMSYRTRDVFNELVGRARGRSWMTELALCSDAAMAARARFFLRTFCGAGGNGGSGRRRRRLWQATNPLTTVV